MKYDVIEVKPVNYLHLKVLFKDKTSGEVIIKESFLTGVFERLKNKDYFFNVSCKHGFVELTDELDLAPDNIYNHIQQFGQWVLE